MAGQIYHQWNGTILTVTSDSGTSSADLKGSKGDTGIRGAQGIAGEKGLSPVVNVDEDENGIPTIAITDSTGTKHVKIAENATVFQVDQGLIPDSENAVANKAVSPMLNSLSNRITQLSSELYDVKTTKCDAILETLTGNYVVMNDATEADLTVLKTHIEVNVDETGKATGYNKAQLNRVTKNITPNVDWEQKTTRGVTFINHKNGEFTISGTATDNTYCGGGLAFVNMGLLPAGKYTASLSKEHAAKVRLRIGKGVDGATYVAASSLTTGLYTFTASGTEYYHLGLYVVAGTDLSNPITVYTQVEAGETATAFSETNSVSIEATLPETIYGGIIDWNNGHVISMYDENGELLAEYQQYGITPQLVSTCKGLNKIWSNTGFTECEYTADIRLYINERFNELATAIVALGG